MKKLLLLLFTFIGITVLNTESLQAQLSVSKTSSKDAAILNKSRPQEPKAIPVPTFVIKTKNNDFMCTIGGVMNPIMGVDLGGELYKTDAGISFIPGDIPLTKVRGQRNDYYINPLNGALDFQFVGFAGTKNEITAYMKIQTTGTTPMLGFSRVYLTWKGFTMGQKLTMFQDLYACQPPTIDPQGPCGDISNVAYEISYQSKSYSGFRFSIGLDMPTYYTSNGMYRGKDFPSFTDSKVIADANEMIPDIPMWIEYQKSPSNRIRLSGIIRNFQYVDLVKNRQRGLVGWGTMISGNFSFWKPLTFNVQAAYGKGIGSYLQDIAGRPVSYIPKDDEPGKMKASPMMGLVFGFSYNATSKLQFNAIASQSRIWQTATYYKDYKYTQYYCGNVFYNLTPYLQWGLEYIYGKKQAWDPVSNYNHRIQSQLMFTF